MKNLNNFFLDQNKAPEILNRDLREYLDNFAKNHKIMDFLDWISNKTELPVSDLNHDTKQFLFNNFSKKNNKFSKKFKFRYVIYSSIRYLFFLIWIILYKNNKKDVTNHAEILIEDINSEDEIKRLSLLKNHFKKTLFVTSFKPKGINNFYLFKKYKNLNFKTYRTSRLFLGCLIKSILLSIRLKTNLIDISFHLLKLNLKYNSIFTNIRGEYLLQERHYNTSSIKSYLFKKYGGKKYSVLQKNIAQLLGPGTYCTADYFFSLGNKTSELAVVSGGKFKKIYPVGSLFMEARYFNENETNIPKLDLINIASNVKNFLDGNENFLKNWYLHFEWVRKFSDEFPKYKIAIKLKEDQLQYDKKFLKIFEKSNVKTIKSPHSYHMAFNAKAICTFSSTMGFELIGNGRDCIFLDPLNCNTSFLPKNEIHNLIKVTTYEDFRKDIIEKVTNKISNKNYNKSDYCLNSEKTSKRISDFLKFSKN